jgi:hypothetical protein
MTTQDLKNNREEIISFINSRNYDLKFAMGMAVEFALNCDSIEELKAELEMYCKPVKESKLARLQAENCEREGTRYNSITKTFEKI